MLFNKTKKLIFALTLCTSLLPALNTKAVQSDVETLTTTLITPANNSSYTNQKVDIQVDLKLNQELLLNNSYKVILINMEKPEFNDGQVFSSGVFEGDYIVNDINTVEFKSLDEVKRITFTSVPLLYQGSNYFHILLGDHTNSSIYYSRNSTPEFTLNYTGEMSPLYRFWSEKKQGHFYTKNNAEKNSLIITDQSWEYEGIGYYVGNNINNNCSLAGQNTIFRFWSDTYQHHFYTANAAEKDDLIKNNKNWSYEGEAFCADITKSETNSEVYRFYSKSKNAHFFTIDSAEKEKLINTDPSWSYEGVAYFAEK